MQTTLEETGKHAVKLTVEVPPEEYTPDIEAAYRRIASSINIPGFRKGKVPRKIIDAQIGHETVIEEFVRDSLYTYYVEALREHDLAPIGDPDLNIDDIDEAKPLTFTAEVEIRPRLALTDADYKGLEVRRPPTEATDEDVSEALD
ncbi:MAG: trigger factor family protein, partial [Actinomycetota bacterium]